MRGGNRKSAPKVRDGKVQRKNRAPETPHWSNQPPGQPIIERQRPGDGYRHVLKVRDVERFIAILPDWDELSRDLKAVLLAPGEFDTAGWHTPGVVAICAANRDLTSLQDFAFYDAHADIYERLNISCERKHNGVLVHFDEQSKRGWQLMHIFLHELGHHHDRITTRSKIGTARGETYAEQYALKYADLLWDRYFREFD
jgi:hypothetical protein